MSRTKSWLILGILCALAAVGLATLLFKEPEFWRPPFLNDVRRYPCEMASIERENPFLVYRGNGTWMKPETGQVRCDDFLIHASFEETVQKAKMQLAGWSASTAENGDFEIEQGRLAVRVYRTPQGSMQRIRVWNLFRMRVGKYVR